MAPSPSSKNIPSPSELAQLEHAFATEPASDAYRPLTEAYLAMGRFMEAMVVCKKGVKAHPDEASARVLLARVYAEQGKSKKALEELQGALQIAPNDLVALRMTGAILCSTGDTEAGAEHLKKAIAADPTDAETAELCRKYKVALPEAPKPAAPQQPAAPPSQAAPQPVAQPKATSATAAPAAPVAAPQAPAQQAASQQAVQAPATASRPTAPRPRPQPRPAVSYEELAAKYGDADDQPRAKRSGTGLIVTVALILIGALGLGGIYFVRKTTSEREQKIAKLLKQMQDELAHDSYAGYKKACELGETIVNELDQDLYSAHAYLAYSYAIRWGEHGEGETIEKLARDHLTSAKGAGAEHAHIIAAEAYIKFFGGDARGAVEELERVNKEQEQKGRKSTLLLSTLGILQTHAGDLDAALSNIKAAQVMAPADARISAALGNVLRRQGNEFLAANYYEQALRYEKDHAEAQLGVALMAVESNKLDTAEKYAKKLLSADPPPSMRQLALARLALAIVLDEQGKKSEADKEEMLALESDPRNGELYILKARRRTRAGNLDAAVEAIREAIKLDPRRASFYVELAKALISKPGGAREAVDSLQQALKGIPNTPKLLVLLGNAHKAANDLDKAKESYEKALAQASKSDEKADAQMALADLARDQKNNAKALELYELAKNLSLLSPRNQAYALTQMGQILEESDKAKALQNYIKASEVDPGFAPPYFLAGRMFSEDKRRRAYALELIEKYLKLAPNGEYAEEARRLTK
ncbi:MAG: tetratricopeptide repeat protein [Myxococcales bacterium]